MFVTFGLTSLLRYLKLRDLDKAEEAWRRRVQLESDIVRSLITVGIEPHPIVESMQVGMPIDAADSVQQATPISSTLLELIRTFKRKGV